MYAFDATIDLVPRFVGSRSLCRHDVAGVCAAVEAIGGAGWIDVEVNLGAPDGCDWLRIYPAGSGRDVPVEFEIALRERIEAAVRGALKDVPGRG